ncbi:hypothetical protein ZOSMA_288G00300 [Zostera marina]|uniref:Uncharacterized protein n=1 Tax=Zostera marina TaxID=29655 RepID=A0A0K9PF37_ZOSMR|nr:hypothetical protein ZOSMA_288G00300 [Zostera marina]
MIPAFGNWDSCDEFQITRYFESARQAGLLRDQSFRKPATGTVNGDLFKLDVVPPSPLHYYYCRKPRKGVVERKHHHQHIEIQNKNQHQRRRQCHYHQNRHHHRNPNEQQYQTKSRNKGVAGEVSKAIDEDLYKIPPELLYQKPKTKTVLANLWKKCMSLDCVP